MTKPLPDGWRLALLGELCAPQKASATPADLAGPYVAMEHLETGRPFTVHHTAGAAVRSSKSRFRAGDVLYGKLRPYLDKAALANFDGICSTELLVLRPIHADPAFLAARLHATDLLDHAIATTTGVNHPRTSWPAMAAFEIPLPPLAEQRRIARFLSRLHRAAALAHHRAALLQRLKSATLAHLFHPDRTAKWERTTLAAISTIQTGPFGSQIHASEYAAMGTPMLNPTDIKGDAVNATNAARLTEAAVAMLAKHRLLKGDTIVARRGEIGRHAHIGPPHEGYICGTGSFLVRPTDPRVVPSFISHSMCTAAAKAYLSEKAQGSIMPNLSGSALGSLPIPLPMPGEQRRISRSLDRLDAALAAARGRARLLDRLFSASLAALMSGELRLPDSIPWLEAQDEAAHA